MCTQSGMFDDQETNGWWYHFPSVAVNCAADMVMGFSGSGRTNYIGAFYTWRVRDGTMLDGPRVIREGETVFDASFRWGDYSATIVDPADDWCFWAVQDYAAPYQVTPGFTVGRRGTVVAKLRPDP